MVPESLEPPSSAARAQRPVLEYVVNAAGGRRGWVKVGLRWPDGQVTTGAAVAAERRESRARAATEAMLKAVRPVLDPSGARVELADVLVHGPAERRSVVVRGAVDTSTREYEVAGAAEILDDVATAAARALLHAINRPLELAVGSGTRARSTAGSTRTVSGSGSR